MEFSTSISDNMNYLNNKLDVDANFDIVHRTFYVGDKLACLYCIEGFTKNDVWQKLMEDFSSLTPEDMLIDVQEFSKKHFPYTQVSLVKDEFTMIKNLLSGLSCLFIDGYDKCLVVDSRNYPTRSVSEPEKDKVLRGSRDGFVETLTFNTALIRRRIRDPKLTIEITNAGESSHTDIAICYFKGRVDEKLLEKIKELIKTVKVDALTMNQESLAECIYPHKWFNPFPKFKYSERPDTTAASLLEGNIVIMVDNSPSAMILPSSVFDIIEEADDYYFPPVTGTYLRLSRFLISILTLFLTPTWLLFMQNSDMIPSWLQFIKLSEIPQVPLLFQLLIFEFAIDGLRLAAVNTPSMLTTPLSVIAGIVLGEYSVKSGWFNSETMLYMSFVTVANYTQSSFELGYAFKFMRMIMLITTAMFNVWGFVGGVLLTVCAVVFNKTIAGKSYIYPLIPFQLSELKKRLFRGRLPHKAK
ncbi:spore germination protein [Lacrimispora algidixylanolytica]|uniref:Spore gernimation protein GerA n=1 Tax=Lacrimispora algidixylanolytica TaxID=94868 RepID=A0A419SZW1_9FIRM|nr:spore germination protein [Lacrimispora algidixylanolytica]RKD30719.1 spore gernimation protein GerA [Lacrimispora algidixylanolytica]